MNNDPPDEHVDVKAHLANFETESVTDAESLHHAAEEINKDYDWDADPAVMLLIAPDSGDDLNQVLVAVLEIHADVPPHRVLPDAVNNLMEMAKVSWPTHHLVAVTFFAEAWGYAIPMDRLDEVTASEETLRNFAKTTARYEGKVLTTIDVVTKDLITSELTRDKDTEFQRAQADGDVATVMRVIAEQQGPSS